MHNRTLSRGEIAAVAAENNIPIDALEAVIAVESAGSGYLPDGQLKILYEAHIFSRLTDHVYDFTNPLISSRFWNRNLYLGGAREWRRLLKAAELNYDAAHESASYGLFQILGLNYKLLNYPTVHHYVSSAIDGGEAMHLKHFITFCSKNRILEALQQRDWAKFARRYNGPGQVPRYSRLLAKASEKAGYRQENDGNEIIVAPGDSLYRIARTHGTSVASILALNPHVTNPNHINAGDRINVA